MFKVITVLSLAFLIMGVQGFAGFKFSDDPASIPISLTSFIKEKNMKIHGIRGELQNLDKNNIEIKFNPKINGLSVVVKDPKIILRSKVEVKKVIKIKGNIKATGKFKSISMDISFIRGLTDWQYIPNVEVKNMDVNMNDKDFKVVFECHKCLKDVKNFVIKLFRKEITKKVRSSIKNFGNKKASPIINKKLQELYPTELNVYQNIGFSLALTEAIRVFDDHLEIPFDGTFFPFSSGYSRPGSVAPMPSYNEENSGDVMVFVNQYVIDSLTETINLEEHNFPLNLLFLELRLLAGPEHGSTDITLTDGSLDIRSSVNIQTNLGVSARFGLAGSLDIDLVRGRGSKIASLITDLQSVRIEALQVEILRQPINLGIFNPMLNLIVRAILWFVTVPDINIPKHEMFPLTVKDSKFEFNTGYIETGILFGGI